MSEQDKLPEEISHYRILEKLGSGGMGDVFLAEDLHLGRRVALKLLPRERTAGSESQNRFRLEARTTSALNHPNIVTIHDAGHVGGYDFIAQEYVPGRTIRELLEDGPLTVAQAIEVAIGVASALRSAHEAGVVHRDVKPENIMIRDDGLVKVLDFGIAKLSRGSEDQTGNDTARALTDPGAVVGTFNYMPPEQILTFDLDARADLFSLGVVLHEMLTGRSPFRRETRGDTVKAILFDPHPEIDDAAVPTRLRELVDLLLRKERGDRIQTSKEVLDDLLEIRGEMPRGGLRGSLLTGLLAPGRRGSTDASRDLPVRRGRWPWLAAASILLLIAIFVYIQHRAGGSSSIESIGVIPFENSGTDPRASDLAVVLSEETTQRLGQINGLRVVAANTMRTYRESSKSAVEIGRELDLDALVLGSVSAEGNKLRVVVDLVDARDGTELWGKTYRPDRSDPYSVQAAISHDISHKLRVELSGGEQSRVSRRPTENAKAYDEYLKGRYVWRENQRRNCRESVSHFQNAIELDPSFALAYVGLADCYNILGSYGEANPETVFPAAKEYAEKALALDDTLAPAHIALAYTLHNYEWDFVGAEREYLIGLDLEPSHATGRYWYGGFLALMGRFEEASQQRALAHALDPLSMTFRTGQGTPHLLARDYETAISYYKSAIHVDPTFPQAHRSLGWAYVTMGGMEREAINEFLAAERLEGRDPAQSTELAYAYAKAGQGAEARNILSHLRRGTRFVSYYDRALAYVALGDYDEAFRLLDLAISGRSNRVTALRVDPALDPIRDDPHFETLLWRTGLHIVPPAERPTDQ